MIILVTPGTLFSSNPAVTLATSPESAWVYKRGNANGGIDKVRVYNRALSQAEALGLAMRQDPIFKKF